MNLEKQTPGDPGGDAGDPSRVTASKVSWDELLTTKVVMVNTKLVDWWMNGLFTIKHLEFNLQIN